MIKDKANVVYDNLFEDEDKIEAFDKIAERYYKSNFGSTSKKDLKHSCFRYITKKL